MAVGGFAFAPEGGAAPHWAGFGSGELVVPEVALARRGGDVRLTVAALASADDVPEELAQRLQARLAELQRGALPLLDPAPAGRFRIASVAPPEHYEAAVARAVERIRAGDFEKIVLAREVAVHAPTAPDAAAIYGVLRAAFASCYVFCAGHGDAAFVAASPGAARPPRGPARVHRRARRARRAARPTRPSTTTSASSSCAPTRSARSRRSSPAGSPARCARTRSGSPRPTSRRSSRSPTSSTSRRRSAPSSPSRAAGELAGLLHPTPAVGGEPHAVATPLIPALEGLDRGWYAGPVGWTDANEDGEFCVALRCALLRGREARLYAGVGVVRDSDPAAELAETEVKLEARCSRSPG